MQDMNMRDPIQYWKHTLVSTHERDTVSQKSPYYFLNHCQKKPISMNFGTQ